jgi:hypothetical protein
VVNGVRVAYRQRAGLNDDIGQPEHREHAGMAVRQRAMAQRVVGPKPQHSKTYPLRWRGTVHGCASNARAQ